MTYNVFHLGWSERLPVIADVIRAQQPDVVALMEATDRSEVASLGANLGMAFCYGEGNHQWAVAWLSRLPILRSQNHQLAPLFHTLLEIQVQHDGVPHRLFATHLRSLGPLSRVGVEARRRAEEVQAILETLRPFKEEPVLLVGDFNSTRPSEPVAWRPPLPEFLRRYHQIPYARRPVGLVLAEGYGDCYRQAHPRRAGEADGYTFMTTCPWERIDFIFASPSLARRLLACAVATGPGTEQASDHFPVWAEFA
jgi:endonuclease/exonuclease/phosphatase family metal-dependent hydrolase